MKPRLAVLLLAALMLAVLPVAAPAAEKADLDRIEQRLQEDRARAEALEQEQISTITELNGLRRQAIAAAKNAQNHEARLIDLETILIELNDRDTAIRVTLSQRRFEMSGTLAALERISRNPPQTLLAYPGAPTRMARSAMLLRVALPRIREEADQLADMLDELTRVRTETREKIAAVAVETTQLEEEQNRLTGILRRKSTLLRQTKSERQEINRRVAELAAKAKSIRDLLSQIEAERARREETERKRREALAERQADALQQPNKDPQQPAPAKVGSAALGKPPGIRPFPTNSPITDPTSARVVRYYGQSNKMGQTERGITYATRPGAQIVAPHDGLVAFAGPFEGYGQILIIEHDGGYHTLLAGLDRLDTAAGQWVLAGEPVGAMGRSAIEGNGLYLELRRGGRPINPQRWIANAKQNGTSG